MVGNIVFYWIVRNLLDLGFLPRIKENLYSDL